MQSMNQLFGRMKGKSRAITAENPHGLKGQGGKAAGPLGVARKGKAFISLAKGETATLVDIEGTGIIQHIWMTVTDQTETGWFVLRDLVLRMYWDNEETPLWKFRWAISFATASAPEQSSILCRLS